MSDVSRLKDRIVRVESILIALTIGLIAFGDYRAGPDVSLGFLYLVPLSYSALTHRLRTTLLLVVLCVILRQWLGPLGRTPWSLIAWDWVLTAIFLVVVATLYRLGEDRRRFFEQARRQRDELMREVERAAEVQRQLLDQHVPPRTRFDIAARNWPARVVGGDYYDFIPVGEDQLGIVIADVAGKGLPAALLMPAVQISLRALTGGASPAEKVLRELNTTLYETTDKASYATLFFGILELKSGLLRYANAGHLPPLLCRRGGGIEELTAGGIPVGLFPESAYQAGEARLRPGDTLLLYTDGVVEARNPEGEEFQAERLRPVLQANSGRPSREIVDSVYSAVTGFTASQALFDDLTAIAIRWRDASDSAN